MINSCCYEKKKVRIRNLILFGTIKDLIDRYEYSELQEELGCLCKEDGLLPLMQDAYMQLKAEDDGEGIAGRNLVGSELLQGYLSIHALSDVCYDKKEQGKYVEC